jgi:hypothetical protein
MFEQQEGKNYQEVFALVVGWTTIHIVIAVVAQHDWLLTHMDVHS